MIKKLLWEEYFEELPPWPCPRCQFGTLQPLPENPVIRESEHSKDAHGHFSWEPDHIDERFSCFLQCQNAECKKLAVSSGYAIHDIDFGYDDDGKPTQYYIRYFQPKSITPAPPIFPLHEEYPAAIRATLKSCFSLFWVDIEAAANRARTCIEIFLDDLGVPPHKTLHGRLELLRTENSDLGDMLMAIKWIGNAGSHNSNNNKIEPKSERRDTVLGALEILEFALDEKYLDRRAKLITKAKQINSTKGM